MSWPQLTFEFLPFVPQYGNLPAGSIVPAKGRLWLSKNAGCLIPRTCKYAATLHGKKGFTDLIKVTDFGMGKNILDYLVGPIYYKP